jgi:hypothetical protein
VLDLLGGGLRTRVSELLRSTAGDHSRSSSSSSSWPYHLSIEGRGGG